MKKNFLKYAEILKKNGIKKSLSEIQRFVSDYFDIPLPKVIAFDFDFSEKMEKKLQEFCLKRGEGIPFSYLTGFAYFYGRKFFVDESVLVPRPETEHIVEFVLKKLPWDFKGRILDCCTGSGNIAITFAKELKNAEVFASDISKNAVKVAKRNSLYHNADVSFILCDKLDCFKPKSFDLIVANPPYIGFLEKDFLEKEVLNEPHIALFGGEKGYEFLEDFLRQAILCVKEKGLIIFEMGYNQIDDVRFFANNVLENVKIRFLKDLNGYFRVGVIENA